MIQVIRGVVPSKSNGYRIITISGHGSLTKTKALKDYEQSFFLQCNQYRNKGITGLFEFHIRTYYPSNRSDIDGCLKVVLDCLQKNGAIKNDNLCVKLVAEKFVDKVNPRIEFQIREL